MSDRMPDPRLPSRARHRAPVAPTSAPAHRLRGKTAKTALALSLALALGGYTVAELSTQRVAAATEQTAVADAARTAAVVAGERATAVEAAQSAVNEATAVQAASAGSLTEAELAPLVEAVAALNALVNDVPASSSTSSTADGGSVRASRSVTRGPAPTAVATPAATPSAAPTSAPAGTEAGSPDLAAAVAASDAAREAALVPAPVIAKATAGAAFRAPAAAPTDKVAVGIETAAAKVAELTAKIKAAADAKEAAAQVAAEAAAEAAAKAKAEQLAAAEAKQAADLAAQKAAQRKSLESFENGKIPADALCSITFAAGQQLRCDAADSLSKLNVAYKAEFGTDIAVSDSYRSYASQVSCSITKGRLCATAGTSNHGLGVALDLGDGIQTFGSRQHAWMVSNASEFGWTLPDWAGPSGSKPEPWHWEYTG